ncbi:hypothetical protein K437DRAFT_72448 [Tilletiaria anomala UBC 951]|uniref:Uncharacterized protein n=1 Tax=Tilletiaria anomala (strain ATCC 24038 / CBS 436.72 / UBC 951) TaxID=1037660 RepID=A0A066WI26_TILAU|nr:uncharacterized protein K437DRAFT_72448 [Tilletiaria anomala UBC 951]KDN53466.1 hypothetical protein K437DRAFT_72448 [Tilletiaria anomala UBC 951]
MSSGACSLPFTRFGCCFFFFRAYRVSSSPSFFAVALSFDTTLAEAASAPEPIMLTGEQWADLLFGYMRIVDKRCAQAAWPIWHKYDSLRASGKNRAAPGTDMDAALLFVGSSCFYLTCCLYASSFGPVSARGTVPPIFFVLSQTCQAHQARAKPVPFSSCMRRCIIQMATHPGILQECISLSPPKHSNVGRKGEWAWEGKSVFCVDCNSGHAHYCAYFRQDGHSARFDNN